MVQAEAFLTSGETALTNISRTASATSHHPAGKKIMSCLVRLVMKVSVIRMYVFLPPPRKLFGSQYQSHGTSFGQASKQRAHLESLENW